MKNLYFWNLSWVRCCDLIFFFFKSQSSWELKYYFSFTDERARVLQKLSNIPVITHLRNGTAHTKPCNPHLKLNILITKHLDLSASKMNCITHWAKRSVLPLTFKRNTKFLLFLSINGGSLGMWGLNHSMVSVSYSLESATMLWTLIGYSVYERGKM